MLKDESGTFIFPERSILKIFPSAVPPEDCHETLSPTEIALLISNFFFQLPCLFVFLSGALLP
jgi:hypothetical protein